MPGKPANEVATQQNGRGHVRVVGSSFGGICAVTLASRRAGRIGQGRALRRLAALLASVALLLPAQAVWLAPPAAAVSCPTPSTSVAK